MYEIDYEDIYDRVINDEDYTSEEFELVLDKTIEKIRAGKPISIYEIRIILESFLPTYQDIIEIGRHGWVLYKDVIKLAENEYYSFKVWEHDDYGTSNDMDDQICLRVEKKLVTTEKWVEVSE